ncbi:hypothetical protein CR203_10320 [Salipaludibacillus neizhouensis]|uniref:Tellurium resistance protein TerC n=1 Tax=Salipaludibacillus neizhouensis TaxID=885475 RepID=A0A3A9KB11_9BACI|nr:TerC family protein [Salipaludibacillus neizhouensis]RKL67732.1 hypothetical protein CR203_10320 [Salipaludibacillus neizhouensis]
MDSEFMISLLTIIGIDIVLGGDNAIVVALACRNLPVHLRNKAIISGILLAVVARGSLTIIAVHLLTVPFLMGIGGLFLLWIALRLIHIEEDPLDLPSHTKLRDAIKTIVIADIVMGFDNVLAVAGAAGGNTMLVFLGLMISIPIIIWGSKIILFIMTKFPIVIYLGAAVLVFTAGKMLLHEDLIISFLSSISFPIAWFIPSLIVSCLIIAALNNKIQGIALFFSRNKTKI